MTLLTEATDVFAAAEPSGRCLVGFIAKRQPLQPGVFGADESRALSDVLDALQGEGWLTSVRAMFEPGAPSGTVVFDAGFAHDADIVGAFEAPSLSAALAGTVRLERAGWARRFATEWLIGPREFSTVPGQGGRRDHVWGFLALWEWNDAWSAATKAERRAYDEECDVAFNGDLALGVNIAGRHRLDWASRWHHAGLWEAPSVNAVDEAMRGHEAAADFKFTTSRHYVGRLRPLADFIEGGRRSIMSACIWIHYARPRPHWYGLDAETQAAHEKSWSEAAAKSVADGGSRVGRFHVRGQQDFETVEIWRFADAETAFDHWARLTAAAYGEFNAFANNIGLSMEESS